MHAIKGQSWSEKREAFLKSPKLNTIFFLRQNQLDLLAKYFEVPMSVITKLESMKSETPGSGTFIASMKTDNRWLIFCIADTLKEQEGELETLAKGKKMMPSI